MRLPRELGHTGKRSKDQVTIFNGRTNKGNSEEVTKENQKTRGFRKQCF